MTDDDLAERVHDVAELMPLVPEHRRVQADQLVRRLERFLDAATRHEQETPP